MHADQLREVFERQRCRTHVPARSTVAERRERLRRLRRVIVSRRDDIMAALQADLGRPPFETEAAEIYHVLKEIDVAVRHIGRWMRGGRARSPLLLLGTSSRLIVEPRGTVIIIAPWNYPFALVMNPLVAAVAAGNCAVIKPAEKAPATAAVVTSVIGEAFAADEVAVVTGGPDVAARLLELPFNHIFFTGSTAVGKLVMAAAAKHLATVTLELGGKTPAVVDVSADVEAAAERIAWGKYFNAGQTCLAPDFVLVHTEVAPRFVDALRKAITAFYGPEDTDRRGTPDLGRIVDDEHFRRLVDLVERSTAMGASVAVGGDWDAATRYFAPTVLTEVRPEMPVMREEIFGPVLPVMTYVSLEDAAHLACPTGTPLGSYVFARDRAAVRRLIQTIPSGGTVVNNTLLHYASSDLPFGGVGESGMGSYHGYHGFLAMSHVRPVVRQREPALARFFFPPYRGRLHALASRVIRWLE